MNSGAVNMGEGYTGQNDAGPVVRRADSKHTNETAPPSSTPNSP
jgi:hypothetical protein